MITYVARRLLQALLMLFLLSGALFALVNLVPGGALVSYSQNRRLNPQQAALLRHQLGLDQPWPLQYVIWLAGNDWLPAAPGAEPGVRRGLLRGDLGLSFRSRQPVLDEIAARLPNTALLMGLTLGVALLIAIPLGLLSSVRQYSLFDVIATTFSFAGQAVPDFWLGLILILVFYGWLTNPATGQPLLPSGGLSTIGAEFSWTDRLTHLILPVATGALGWIAWYSRFVRSSMLDVIHADYIRTARAKGLPEYKVLLKHALRNALIPLLTLFALDLPALFSGAVYIEIIFAWPGMGRLYYQAAEQRDYPMLMGVLTIGAGLIILTNLLADVLYGYLDPRIRFG